METVCSYYFLSETAMKIWAEKNEKEEEKMFGCLYTVHRPDFFKQVVFPNGVVHEIILHEIAEEVFWNSWQAFNNAGKNGLKLQKKTYTGYFFSVFKNNYLKRLETAVTRESKQKAFEKDRPKVGQPITERVPAFSFQTQYAFDKSTKDCQKLLRWKHIDELTYDEIAVIKGISRDSAIKMVSRCGRRFFNTYTGGDKK